jgi:hypothetical protein
MEVDAEVIGIALAVFWLVCAGVFVLAIAYAEHEHEQEQEHEGERKKAPRAGRRHLVRRYSRRRREPRRVGVVPSIPLAGNGGSPSDQAPPRGDGGGDAVRKPEISHRQARCFETSSSRGPAMLDFIRGQIDYALESPVERLLKPAIKTVVIVGILVVVAEWLSSRSFDRKSLAQLAGSSAAKQAVKPSSKH